MSSCSHWLSIWFLNARKCFISLVSINKLGQLCLRGNALHDSISHPSWTSSRRNTLVPASCSAWSGTSVHQRSEVVWAGHCLRLDSILLKCWVSSHLCTHTWTIRNDFIRFDYSVDMRTSSSRAAPNVSLWMRPPRWRYKAVSCKTLVFVCLLNPIIINLLGVFMLDSSDIENKPVH